MIQPIETAINYFLGFFQVLPVSVRNFIGLVCVVFAVAVLIKLLFHMR